MNKITDYYLIGRESNRELSEAVVECIKSGYQPFGSPYLDRRNEYRLFHYQAVVKYEEVKILPLFLWKGETPEEMTEEDREDMRKNFLSPLPPSRI